MKPLDLEKLAKLEHDQWVEWSKEIAKTEKISKTRLERWKKLWVDYNNLPEDVKEQDRKWARKVMSHIKQTCEFYLRYKDNPELLYKEHPIYYDEINEIYRRDIELTEKAEHAKVWSGKSYFIEKYNKWLFRLTFNLR